MPIDTRFVNQQARFAYTRKDIDLIDAEVDDYITHFIPTIKNTSTANIGRLYLRIIEGLVDKLNYSMDMTVRQTALPTVTDLQSAINLAQNTRYYFTGTSTASTDLTATALAGVAGVGGISIAQYSIFRTNGTPIKQFISTTATSISEGAATTTVPVIQGVRYTGQTLIAAAVGSRNESVTLSVASTPLDYIELLVNGTAWTRVDNLDDSQYNDRHWYATVDEDLYVTINVGNGEFGATFPVGAAVTANYVISQGLTGNTPANTITVVEGALSSDISVTNSVMASGGSDGDTVFDIVDNAPATASSFGVPYNKTSYAALARDVAGVYSSLAESSDSTTMNLYIMPTGGGEASATLITAVEDYINPLEIHGMNLNVDSLLAANIWVQMEVVLQETGINKSIARKKVYEAIAATKLNGSANTSGLLYYTNLTVGKGFAFSDISSAIENIDDGNFVDFVTYSIFTRYPTPIAGNGATTVFFVGNIVPTTLASYDDWSIQRITNTTFYLYKNGVIDSSGTLGTEHTSTDGSIVFTLGEAGDTLTTSDYWTFSTSDYKNTMKLSSREFLQLDQDSDLGITVYYPEEYTIG